MLIEVRAKPNSKKPKVVQLSENKFVISVSEPATDGKANTAIAAALAGHLGMSKSRVFLKHGASSRDKVFEIL